MLLLYWVVMFHFIQRWSGLFSRVCFCLPWPCALVKHLFLSFVTKGKQNSLLPITLVTFSRKLEEECECGVLCACVFPDVLMRLVAHKTTVIIFYLYFTHKKKSSCKTKKHVRDISILVIKHLIVHVCFILSCFSFAVE